MKTKVVDDDVSRFGQNGHFFLRILFVLFEVYFVDALHADGGLLPGLQEVDQTIDLAIELSNDVLCRHQHAQRHLGIDYGLRDEVDDQEVFALVDGHRARSLHLLHP